MRIDKERWTKTRIPLLWSRRWYAMMDTAPNVCFIDGKDYRISISEPCDHDYKQVELHGDQRLAYDARYINVCSKCHKLR